MRLIDGEKLKKEILIRCDDLEDLGLLDDVRGLQHALKLLDQMPPVLAVRMEDVNKILETAKNEVSKKVIEMFTEQFKWQVWKEQEERGGQNEQTD